MVGIMSDAARALARELPYLGDGWSRIAYLLDDVVYKVEKNMGARYGINVAEYDNIVKFVSASSFISVPAATLFRIDDTPVIAMEFIHGEPVGECYCVENEQCTNDCLTPIETEMLREAGMTDISYGNIMRTDTGLAIVDFGE